MTNLWEQNLWPVVWGVAVGASACAAWIDTRTHRIPNRLTGPLFLGGVIWSTAVGGWAGLGESLLGCLIAALPHLIIYALAGCRAADAKMMGALGAWLGPVGGLAVMATVALVGGVLAVTYSLVYGKHKAMFSNLLAMVFSLGVFMKARLGGGSATRFFPQPEQMHPMPYGLAIAAGVAVAAGGVCLWHAT